MSSTSTVTCPHFSTFHCGTFVRRPRSKSKEALADISFPRTLPARGVFETINMNLLQEAFALLEAAKELEVRASSLAHRPATAPTEKQEKQEKEEQSWVMLNRSADMYYEACHLMTGFIRNSVRNGTLNGSLPDDKTKRLLMENIRRYEPHADGLRSKAVLFKNAEEARLKAAEGGTAENASTRESSSQSDQPSQVETQKWENFTENGNGESNATSNNDSSHAQQEASKAAGKASSLLSIAKHNDEMGEKDEAIREYIQAAQLYLHAVGLLSHGPLSEEIKSTILALRRTIKVTLDRVEVLKNCSAAQSPTPTTSLGVRQPGTQQEHQPSLQSDKLTPYEIKVLSWSSRIASGIFLPWSDEEVQAYDYHPARPYADPDGNLKTSHKQREKLCKWARPSEIVGMRRRNESSASPSCNIVMVKSITPHTIKQHCVDDCSFIAGLCIAAAYERRFHRQLVSSLIYPQDKTGMPVWNPEGVYIVKLWFNGVARRVIVDDFLPVDEHGNLLCSHTTAAVSEKRENKGSSNVLELWVPILEKAYMKVCLRNRMHYMYVFNLTLATHPKSYVEDTTSPALIQGSICFV